MLSTFLKTIDPSIDDELIETYKAHWTEKTFPRKQILTAEGEVQRDIYFVLEGVQKSYFLNEGKEHVMAFTYAPSLSGIPESFFNQTPSDYFLECITESRLLRISYAQHSELVAEHRPLETLFRKGTEHLLCGLSIRYRELMAFDIETRFRHFCKRSPHLLNLVPHKDLASYLRRVPFKFQQVDGQS